MNTLVIYDNSGTIFFQASGGTQEPIGLQHMFVDVPAGQVIQRIDTSTETHTPVFIEIPKPAIEIEMEQQAQEIDTLKLMVADLGLMVGGGL